MTRNMLAALGGVLLFSLLWALPIVAQQLPADAQSPFAPNATPAQVAFTLRSGSTAWLDSNKACAPDYKGPHALWLVVGMTNNSTETLTNVVATLSGFTSPYYTLTADPVRYIGVLSPTSTFYGYWYVSYACASGHVDTYTVTLSAANLTGNAYYVGSLTTATAIDTANEAQVVSAAANSSQLAVGQVYTQVVRYQLSSSNASALFQPTGESNFADACFRLVASRITNSTISGVSNGTTHQLHFSGSLSSGTVDVVYDWQALCYAESTSTPWAVVQSPAKYSNNYGIRFSTFPTASLSLDASVSVTPVLLTGAGAVTYTVRLSNRFAQPIVVNGVNFGLPQNVVYKGVGATSAIRNNNSSHYPSLNATGALKWLGLPALSYTVPASGTQSAGQPGVIDLVFTAAAPAITGRYTAVTSATVGTLDVGPLNATFDVELPTAVKLAAFDATPQGQAVLITWETASELDNVGFNLYRSETADGAYVRLNATLIPPQNPGSVMGGYYEWLDADAQPGVVYFYKLEDIDIQGVSAFHGPISAAVATAPTAVRLRDFNARAPLLPVFLGGLLLVLLRRTAFNRSLSRRIRQLHAQPRIFQRDRRLPRKHGGEGDLILGEGCVRLPRQR